MTTPPGKSKGRCFFSCFRVKKPQKLTTPEGPKKCESSLVWKNVESNEWKEKVWSTRMSFYSYGEAMLAAIYAVNTAT